MYMVSRVTHHHTVRNRLGYREANWGTYRRRRNVLLFLLLDLDMLRGACGKERLQPLALGSDGTALGNPLRALMFSQCTQLGGAPRCNARGRLAPPRRCPLCFLR